MLFFKYHKKFYLILISIILIGCQFQEPFKNHGITFLKNRSEKLVLNRSNKNDTIKVMGQPHSKSINDENEWIYIERVLSKGEFHRLGQNILKENNVLVLGFNKYGVLIEKKFLDKNDIEDITFSKKTTENQLSKKRFIQSFLQSVKTKMYGNK